MPAHIVPPSPEAPAEAQQRAAALAEGLFTHQIEGVAFLLGRRRAILADDMGLGKTRQSVVALTEAAAAGPYLVICPASVKRNWQREILAARPASSTRIIGPGAVPARGFSGWAIINYDILGKHIDALLQHSWAGIVFDEAHYLKNHKSQRSRFGRQLVDAAGPDPIVHLLTGTPLTNRPRDLFPLLQLARHPMARSFLSFAKRYCAAVHNGYGWDTRGASNITELREQLHGLMLRRTKDDVLDLPPKVRTWLTVDVPDGTARRESRRVLELLIAAKVAGEDKRGRKYIALLGELTKARRKIAIAKIKHTIDLVQDAVDNDEKVLVFSCFSDPALEIAEHFGEAALLLTGETPAAERQDVADAFQSDVRKRVLVANIIAGGIGLNLTAARQVVFNDLDWVPANHWQAEDRAYRIGQTRTVNVSYMVAAGTIDDFVARTLETKASLVDVVVEGAYLPSDLLSSLEELVGSFTAGSGRGSGSGLPGADAVDRLLSEVTREFEQKSLVAAEARKRSGLTDDAIAKLATVLAGPRGARYRVRSSRKADVEYTLDVDGPDVICSCPGFEYRGNCTHARALKKALTTGAAVPGEFVLID